MAARATVICILSLAGACGFLISFIALQSGLEAMWVRYALAGVAAYLTFLILVRIWIGLRRSTRNRRGFDALDTIDLPIAKSGSRGADDFSIGGGGRSGGAGASDSWLPAGGRSFTDAPEAFDLSDGWPVGLAIAVLFGGALAVGYVVWIAPVMVAELAIDAAIMSSVYGRLRSSQRARHTSLVRSTWLPATAVILTLIAAGWVMQTLVPGARSIGGFVAGPR